MAKASLRDIRKRIASVRSTQQITKAMKMVATAKLRRAQENILATRPYATKMLDVLSSLAARTSADVHPFLAGGNPNGWRLWSLLRTGGLCGAFNMNLIQRAEKFKEEEKSGAEVITFSFIGRKGRDYFRKTKSKHSPGVRKPFWQGGLSSGFAHWTGPGGSLCRRTGGRHLPALQ